MEMKEIELDRIKNINQVRKNFDNESLKELAKSIEKLGVLHPISVKKDGDKYVIISGERRWKASKIAKKKTIPCIVKDNISESDFLIENLIENLQREDLNPIEKAEGIKEIINSLITEEGLESEYKIVLKIREKIRRKEKLTETELKIKESIDSLGLSLSNSMMYLKLLNLHPELKMRIIKRQGQKKDISDDFETLTLNQGRELSRIKDQNVQMKVYQKAKGWRFGSYQLNKLISNIIAEKVDLRTFIPKKKQININNMVDSLSVNFSMISMQIIHVINNYGDLTKQQKNKLYPILDLLIKRCDKLIKMLSKDYEGIKDDAESEMH